MTYFVEEINARGALNTYVFNSFEQAMSFHDTLIRYYGDSRVFQILHGVEVDLTG